MMSFDYHPVCLAFAAYDSAAFARRAADYRDHPERADDTAVLIAEDPADGEWKIADGRHHYLICRTLGYECEFQRFAGTRSELVALVRSRNALRRHDTESQIAAALAVLCEWERGGDRRSDDFKGSREPLKSQAAVAAEAGIGRETLKRTVKVAKKAPELLPAVRDGKLDAKTAAKAADLPADVRQTIAEADDPKAAAMVATTPDRSATNFPLAEAVSEPSGRASQVAAEPTETPTPTTGTSVNTGSPAGDEWPPANMRAVRYKVEMARGVAANKGERLYRLDRLTPKPIAEMGRAAYLDDLTLCYRLAVEQAEHLRGALELLAAAPAPPPDPAPGAPLTADEAATPLTGEDQVREVTVAINDIKLAKRNLVKVRASVNDALHGKAGRRVLAALNGAPGGGWFESDDLPERSRRSKGGYVVFAERAYTTPGVSELLRQFSTAITLLSRLLPEPAPARKRQHRRGAR